MRRFITGSESAHPARPAAEAVFARKTRLSMSVLPDRSAILTSVVKIALKVSSICVCALLCERLRSDCQSYSEYLRLKVLGKSGFQQVQVEVYFLRRALRTFVDDQGCEARFVHLIAHCCLTKISEFCMAWPTSCFRAPWIAASSLCSSTQR